MSVALAAHAPVTFEIKSASLPLVALLLKSPDLGLLSQEMKQRFGDMPDFFDHDPVVIDLSPLQASELAHSPVDFPALISLLRDYRLVPAAVRGGNEPQTAAALLAGLIQANDASIHRGANGSALTAVAASAQPGVAPASSPAAQTTTAAAVPAPSPPAPPTQPTGAMVIDKPLRSGQQVYARGRDLVVLAMVNPGAEVIADGHIHVYAPLRGKAIAGARGNTDARIFALSMDPELISIAGIYRTSENPLPPQVLGQTAQVRLAPGPDGDKLLFEPLAN